MNMENKVYGMKPSYKIMKSLIKKYCEKGSYCWHSTNLVYYAIKHDFTEEQAIEYFTKSMDQCEKMLMHHSYGAHFRIDYELMKDVLNVSLDDFALKEFRYYDYKYDYEKRLWNYDISHMIISFSYEYYAPDYSKKPLFRDYNDHTVYLWDKIEKHGYYNKRIDFWKIYDEKNTNDTVFVVYKENYNAAGSNASKRTLDIHKKEFINICIGLWHFIKLLDCSENPNDIDIKEIYKRKDKVAQLFDHTQRELETYKLEQKLKNKK